MVLHLLHVFHPSQIRSVTCKSGDFGSRNLPFFCDNGVGIFDWFRVGIITVENKTAAATAIPCPVTEFDSGLPFPRDENGLALLGTNRCPFTVYAVQIPPKSFTTLTEMFSRVSEKVLPQPPSANKKKNYEIQEVLGTGSFGKVMVRPSSRLSRVSF
jgi:hypothetical protein